MNHLLELWVADAWRDARFGLRSLRRSPGFAAFAILCVALGIGATAALFSVVDAVLLRPFPYAHPERLVRLYEKLPTGVLGSVSVPNLDDWRRQSTTFEHLAGWFSTNFTLEGAAEPERVRAVSATADLFSVLGVHPLRGRAFVPGDDEPDRARVALVSEPLWRMRFGADPALVGREIRLDGKPHVVIGVMPAAFEFPVGGTGTDVWTAYPRPKEADRGAHQLNGIGLLRSGVPLERARVELRQVAARLARAYPETQAGRSAEARPFRDTVVESSRPRLRLLAGTAALVLLIACTNVANLLLARAAGRRPEVAVRLALGASRARLVRQLLVESLVLAVAGALAGAFLAERGLALLSPLVERTLPILGGVGLDRRIFVFLLVVTVLSALAFGLAPALQAVGKEVGDGFAASVKATRGRRQRRVQNALVVLEIALSLMLLVGAGLLLRELWRLRATPTGLDIRNVLTAHLVVPDERLPGAATRIFDPLLAAARSLPGARAAAVISRLPLQSFGSNGTYRVEGKPVPGPGEEPLAELRVASPQSFAALGIPLRRGRDFTAGDSPPGARVVIINEALARQQFPTENPIGRQISLEEEMPLTIIGVVGSVRQAGLDRAPLPEIYLPHTAAEDWLGDATLVIRTAVPPASLVGALRRAVRNVDPTLPLFRVATMESVVAESLESRRLNFWLLGLFAGIALVLSASGLFGVISYLVAERRREIGTRIALGAQRRDVHGLMMRQGAALAAAGLGLGLLAALAFVRLLESFLRVGVRDPLTILGCTLFLAVVAGLATWLPTRRALRVEPMEALNPG